MKDFNLFSFGVANLRLQSSPSQVELQEMEQDYQQFPANVLSCEEVDRMAGLDFETRTEAQRNCPVRINRKTD